MSVSEPIPPATVAEIPVLLGYDPEFVDQLRISIRGGRIDVIGRDPESGGSVRRVHLIEEPEDPDPDPEDPEDPDPGSS